MGLGKVAFFVLSFAIRMGFIAFADHVDRTSPNSKYTDIDYMVFSEAATHVYNGNSPYNRLTYRYTPLVAYLLTINNFIHPLAGKVLFCIFDIITGIYLWKILEIINPKSLKNGYLVAFWVLNPLVIVLSTRGSNDNMITLQVFIAAYYVLKRQYVIAGFMFGLSVHFKIYPIIYSVVFYLFIDCDFALIRQNKKWEAFKKNFFTKNRLVFTAVSASTFIGLTGLFYLVYGYEFLYETYLYHLVRKDNRHNFSVYWYLMYQLYEEQNSTLIGILTFVPQWGLVALCGFMFYYDMFFALLVQTSCFVLFNKVITVQYFLWYISILPLCMTHMHLRKNWCFYMLGVVPYVTSILIWVSYAFKFEFQLEQVFNEIQYANYFFFVGSFLQIWVVISKKQLIVTKQAANIEKIKTK